MTQLTPEQITLFETGAKAFNEYKGKIEDLDKKFKDITDLSAKLDGLDKATFDKLAKDIGESIEVSQKANARAKEIEDHNKNLETEITALKTALNRIPADTGKDSGEKSKETQKKLFNDFARKNSSRQEAFNEFLKDSEAPEAKTLYAGSDPQGGYLVMPEITGPQTEFVYETSPIRQLATVTTIGTDTLEIILDNDQAGSGWIGETDTRSSTTTPTFQKVEIPVNELSANAPITQKMLDDATIDLESYISQKVNDRFARDEATAFVTGNGVSKPKGLASYTSGTDTTLKQVEQVVTGDASNFTYDGIVNLQAALKEAYQPNAVFLLRRASIANIMQIKDGNGQPIFNMFMAGNTGNNAGMATTIMGKKIYFAADVAAIAGNALAMIYGDIRRAYQIVDRTGVRILRDPFTNKPFVQFYFTKRVGGGVKNFEAVKIQKISS